MQISLFDGKQNFEINKPVRLIELFAGIGSQAKAFELLNKYCGVEFEHYRVVEYNPKAMDSYNVLHNTNFEAMDITKVSSNDLGIVDTDRYCYIMTYSFPCQDLSNAGLKKGMMKGDNTRSGLLWEVERILKDCVQCYCGSERWADMTLCCCEATQDKRDKYECEYWFDYTHLPQVLLMENVPEVAKGENANHFNKWCEFLQELGYKNYGKVLNAKNYGIPQSRNRYFMVSILGDYYYNFPQPKKLSLRLKDILENKVDPKFYINNAKIKSILSSNYCQQKVQIQDPAKHSGTLCARDWKDPKCVVFGELDNGAKNFANHNSVFSCESIAPTIVAQGNSAVTKIMDTAVTMCINSQVDGVQPSLQDRVYSNIGIATACTTSYITNVLVDNANKPKCILADVQYDINHDQTARVYNTQGISPTLTTQTGGNLEKKIQELSGKVRKLTPREYFRLMGFEDGDFDKVQSLQSKTALYTQAGNSIVVSVLVTIFSELYKDKINIEYVNKQGVCGYGTRDCK